MNQLAKVLSQTKVGEILSDVASHFGLSLLVMDAGGVPLLHADVACGTPTCRVATGCTRKGAR